MESSITQLGTVLPGADSGVPASGTRARARLKSAAGRTPPVALTGFEFVVPGDCVPWARAGRSANGHSFTPAKQARYMAALKLICQAAMKGTPPLDGSIEVVICAAYARPQSWSKKRKASTTWRTSKPDADNLAKIVGDSLNRVAWVDDAQIAMLVVKKYYADMPGLRVGVRRIG